MFDDMTPEEIEEMEKAMDDLEEQQDRELQATYGEIIDERRTTGEVLQDKTFSQMIRSRLPRDFEGAFRFTPEDKSNPKFVGSEDGYAMLDMAEMNLNINFVADWSWTKTLRFLIFIYTDDNLLAFTPEARAEQPVWLEEDYYNANAATVNRNIELKLQGKFPDGITLLRPNVEGSLLFLCVMTAGKLIRISFFVCCPSQANEDDFDNATEWLVYDLAELITSTH